MKNWRTTLMGAIGGITLIIKGIASQPLDVTMIIAGVAAVCTGFFAKDSVVTGTGA